MSYTKSADPGGCAV